MEPSKYYITGYEYIRVISASTFWTKSDKEDPDYLPLFILITEDKRARSSILFSPSSPCLEYVAAYCQRACRDETRRGGPIITAGTRNRCKGPCRRLQAWKCSRATYKARLSDVPVRQSSSSKVDSGRSCGTTLAPIPFSYKHRLSFSLGPSLTVQSFLPCCSLSCFPRAAPLNVVKNSTARLSAIFLPSLFLVTRFWPLSPERCGMMQSRNIRAVYALLGGEKKMRFVGGVTMVFFFFKVA